MATFDPNWASAIASLESAGSGGYGAVGPMTRSGNRAYGRYQVMDFNIPNWTRKYVGREMTPDEFLADPRAQDLVFQGEFGSYVNQYGSPEEAASVWFTGRPMSQGAGASDILGTTGAQYVDRFNAALSDPNVIARGIGNDALVAIGKAPTQRTEAPMGLLDMGQPQGQPQPQGQQGGFWDRFAGGILADPDRRARLAMALEGMTLNPNQALIQAAQSGIEERRTQGQANRTIEYLRSQPGGEQFIPLVEVAGAGGALQAYLQAKAGQDPTSAMQNYKFLISQGLSPEQAMARAFTNSNVPPQIGTIPQGYELFEDPETGAYRLQPIAGGPADTSAETTASQEQTSRAAGVVLDDINRLQTILSESILPITGGWSLLTYIPGTNAYDASGLVKTIRGNIGFDRLQQMRDASPTGGALGAINKTELDTLQSVLGDLDMKQSQEQFEYNLKRLEQIYIEIMNKASAYPNAAQFGFGVGATSSDGFAVTGQVGQ